MGRTEEGKTALNWIERWSKREGTRRDRGKRERERERKGKKKKKKK